VPMQVAHVTLDKSNNWARYEYRNETELFRG